MLIGFMLPVQIFAQVWVARYDKYGIGSGAVAIAVDDSGYVYITGDSFDTTFSEDYVTIKYNSSGDTVWVRRYNGPDKYSADNAFAIAVDKNGNVYVTGRSTGIGTDYDYATVKYNNTGNEMWVKRYNYSTTNYNWDGAYAIAVDNNGNVYVTGASDSGNGSNYDYATIKYDSLGNTLWERRYNGPNNKLDAAYVLTVGNNGNVYVTGVSRGLTYTDYATIKYNGSGDTAWVRRYSDTTKEYLGSKEYDYDKAKGFTHGGGGGGYCG